MFCERPRIAEAIFFLRITISIPTAPIPKSAKLEAGRYDLCGDGFVFESALSLEQREAMSECVGGMKVNCSELGMLIQNPINKIPFLRLMGTEIRSDPGAPVSLDMVMMNLFKISLIPESGVMHGHDCRGT